MKRKQFELFLESPCLTDGNMQIYRIIRLLYNSLAVLAESIHSIARSWIQSD